MTAAAARQSRFLSHVALSDLTNERVLPPFFDEFFSTADRAVLGKGIQGTVYKTRINPTAPTRFPPSLNTNDFYAVKEESVEVGGTEETRNREAIVSLWLGQVWSAAMPNVAHILFWLRTRAEGTLTTNYATVMHLVSGGTARALLETIESDLMKKTAVGEADIKTWKLSVSTVIAQAFAGICEVRAAGIKDFVHGDFHPANVLAQDDRARTCLVFDLGDGNAIVAPTSACKDRLLRITDFGFSSGTISTGGGTRDQVIMPALARRTDNEKFCSSVASIHNTLLFFVLKETEDALATVKTLLQDEGRYDASREIHEKNESKLQKAGDAIRQNKYFVDADGEPAVAALSTLSSYVRYNTQAPDSTAQQIQERRQKYPALTHYYYSPLRQWLWFMGDVATLATSSDSLLQLLQTHEVFEDLRTANTVAARDKLVKETFLGGDAAALSTVGWTPVSLVPTTRTDLEYVNGRLAQ